MKNGKSHYSEPKGRIFERGTELRDVVVIGKDQNGEPQLWSTFDEAATNEFLETAGVLEPTA